MKKYKLKEEQLADKIISEMQKYGLTPDQMLSVLKKAKEIFKIKQNRRN